MATVVDTLVTKFTLDNTQYNAAADKVVAKTNAASAKMTRALAVKPPPVMGGGGKGMGALAALDPSNLAAFGSAVGTGILGAAVVLGAATAKLITAQADFAAHAYEKFSKLDPETGGVMSKFNATADRATLVVGSVVSETLNPIIEEITATLEKLIEDGTIEEVAQSFMAIVKAITKDNDIPTIMRNLANTVIGVNEALLKMGQVAVKLIDTFTPWIVKKLGGGVGNSLREAGERKAKGDSKDDERAAAKLNRENERKAKGDSKDDERAAAKLNRENERKAKEEERDRESLNRSNAAYSQARYLAMIASNTRRMVDLQEMIVGGGGLAAMGISANDLSMYRTSRNRPPSTDPMLQRLGIYVTTQTLATMGGVR